MKYNTLNKEQKKYLTDAIKACERASDLLMRLRTISIDEKYKLTSVELFNITAEVLDLATMNAHSRDINIDLIISFEPGEFFVKANASALYRIMLNLAKNAVKAIEEKGNKTGNFIKVKAQNKDEYVEILFEDSGIGMSKEIMKKAFDPMFAMKCYDGKEGQGLGLAVVKEIISKDFNGYIDVKSTRGVGTTFSLCIPRAQKNASDTGKDVFTKVNKAQKTVLVVDDEEMIRDSLEKMLVRFGYKVLTAENGRQGVDIYKNNQADLIILDLIMPKMSGKEMLKEIIEYDKNAKVIITSGAEENISNDKILINAKDFLKKPYSPKLLLETIRSILSEEADTE